MLKSLLKKILPDSFRMWIRACKARIKPLPQAYGKPFLHFYQLVQESQWWSRDRIEEYQYKKLTDLLNHAYNNVPYYHRIFNELGLKPSDFKEINDLSMLPLLTKDDVINHFDELKAQNLRLYKPQISHTSGTTGRPFEFLLDQQSLDLENALAWRHWNWAGYSFGDKRVQLRQNLEYESKSKIMWRYDPLENSLGFFTFQVNEMNMKKFFEHLKRFQPKMLRGYPSYVFLFAQFLNANKMNARNIVQSVTTHSEMLYAYQRKEIENAFGCQVFSHYGCGEYIINGCECDRHEGLHINIERGILELIHNGRTVQAGEVGELVATGFNNYSMPLIRYCIKDYGTLKTSSCPCGRQAPLLGSIEGRESDIIKIHDGRYIFPTGVIDLMDSMYQIKDSRLIQKDLKHFTLKIIKGPEYKKHHSLELKKRMETIFGKDIYIQLEFVETIERSRTGKFRWFISELASSQ